LHTCIFVYLSIRCKSRGTSCANKSVQFVMANPWRRRRRPRRWWWWWW